MYGKRYKDGFIIHNNKDKHSFLIAYNNNNELILKSNYKNSKLYKFIYLICVLDKDMNSLKDVFKNYLLVYCIDGYKFMDLKDYKPKKEHKTHSDLSNKFIELVCTIE